METEYKPFIQTKRFDIFAHRIVRSLNAGEPREVYQAWYRDEDIPFPVCVVTIWSPASMSENYLEWIETNSGHRRLEIATEVLRGIESEIGDIDMEGVTDEGVAFVESYCGGDDGHSAGTGGE